MLVAAALAVLVLLSLILSMVPYPGVAARPRPWTGAWQSGC
jgi:hypothetical protein